MPWQMAPGGRLVLCALSYRNSAEGWSGPRRISEAAIRLSLRSCDAPRPDSMLWPCRAALPSASIVCCWLPLLSEPAKGRCTYCSHVHISLLIVVENCAGVLVSTMSCSGLEASVSITDVLLCALLLWVAGFGLLSGLLQVLLIANKGRTRKQAA